MTPKEYRDLPKGRPATEFVGERFRTKESVDKDWNPGERISFYEIINTTEFGYEFMEKFDVIE